MGRGASVASGGGVSIDIEAVKARHGISTEHYQHTASPYVWEAWFAGHYDNGEDGRTEVDAVCALLKTRWGITAEQDGGSWHAVRYSTPRHHPGKRGDIVVRTATHPCAAHPTELGAVVELADRLAGVNS
jgi:hypothetical protein